MLECYRTLRFHRTSISLPSYDSMICNIFFHTRFTKTLRVLRQAFLHGPQKHFVAILPNAFLPSLTIFQVRFRSKSPTIHKFSPPFPPTRLQVPFNAQNSMRKSQCGQLPFHSMHNSCISHQSSVSFISFKPLVCIIFPATAVFSGSFSSVCSSSSQF